MLSCIDHETALLQFYIIFVLGEVKKYRKILPMLDICILCQEGFR